MNHRATQQLHHMPEPMNATDKERALRNRNRADVIAFHKGLLQGTFYLSHLVKLEGQKR